MTTYFFGIGELLLVKDPGLLNLLLEIVWSWENGGGLRVLLDFIFALALPLNWLVAYVLLVDSPLSKSTLGHLVQLVGSFSFKHRPEH